MKSKPIFLSFVLLSVFCAGVLADSGSGSSGSGGTVIVVGPTQSGSGSGSSVSSPPIVVNVGQGTVVATAGTPAYQAEHDPVGTAEEVIADVKGGKWRLVIAAILGAIMVIGAKVAPGLFGSTDRGKAITIMVLSLIGAVSASLATNMSVIGAVTGAATLAFVAVGGRQWISRVLWPADGGKQYLTWLKPLLGVTTPTPNTTPSTPLPPSTGTTSL